MVSHYVGCYLSYLQQPCNHDQGLGPIETVSVAHTLTEPPYSR